MYVPEHFRESDPEVLHAFIRAHGFATLVSNSADGMIATHLPLLLDAERGRHGTLIGHLARANPHGAALAGGEALAIFHGPHAYVSPQWYATPMAVPTWNYVAVHAYGTPRLVEGGAELRAILDRTVATFEASFAYQWRPPAGDFVEKLMKGVVGFEIEIARLDGKAKLSQNRSPADRAGTIAGLRATGQLEAAGVAELMERRLATS